MENNQPHKKPILPCVAFLLVLLTQTASCYDVSFDQFIKSTPSTFGLITVTHTRNGAYLYIRKHIDRYAEMDCPEITQLSVVWNNDDTPESVGFTQSPTWKRPVYFVKTPYNSMDFRYTLPKQSKAKVFFSVDDDIDITCEQMRKSFDLWKSKAIGDLGPLISYGPRGFNFNTNTEQYIYTDPLRARFYSISLIGICWVPRFYFQLYNSQQSLEINSMREIVKQKNNCDDIALNFIISYFFPDFIPIPLEQHGALTMRIQPSSQGLTNTHYPYRNQCLKKFTEILGYNPLRILNKADSGNSNRFTSVVSKYAIYMKKKQLTQKLLQDNGGGNKQISMQEMLELQQQIKQQISEKKQNYYQQLSLKNSNAQQDDQIILLKQQLLKTKQEYNSLLREIAQFQQNSRGSELDDEEEDKKIAKLEAQQLKIQTESKQKIERTRYAIDLIFNIMVFVTVAVIFMFICLVKNCCASPQTSQRKQSKKQSKKWKQVQRTQRIIPTGGIMGGN